MDKPRMRYEIESELDGPYWGNEMVAVMLQIDSDVDPKDMMTNYFQMEASKSTPQYGFHKGLEIFNEDGWDAAVAELKDNLIGRDCIKMLGKAEITQDIRKCALNYLMFLKRKGCGRVKGRGCADGRPQQDYITKDESSSPTVSIYALMASCVLDAIDSRHVITIDIPGVFLQGEWPQSEHPGYIKFTGIMVDMICQIDPGYKNNIIWSRDKKQKFLYGRLQKAVYGTLLAAVIFYNKLSKHLQDDGFVMNAYDECTFNKMVDGEQLTVQFHVDDLKALHKSELVLKQFVSNLKKEFGKEDELSECVGKVHDYLGMTLNYSIPGKVAFTMYDYLEDVIVEAPAELKKGRSAYPANEKLFKLPEGSEKLCNEKSDLFHRLVARLLFASKRARPDIQVPVAFLCTRVKNPTVDDCMKLGKVICYLAETIHLPLILGMDADGNFTWNVDASFAVNPDCRSHTGASMTLGHGSMLSLSLKQKINAKSSTEAELIAVDDAMTFIMWMKHFLTEQTKMLPLESKLKGLGKETIIEQDNTSTIQLERNGWRSSSKRTKHINVRYFFVTDRLKAGDVTRVVYKPTELMESDFLTKALMGKSFHAHRETLMGLKGIDVYQFYNTYKKLKTNT